MSQAIGQRIAYMRSLLGWSQRELAGRIGINHTTVSRLERGSPASSNLTYYAAIAQAFGIARDILTMEDEAFAQHLIRRWFRLRMRGEALRVMEEYKHLAAASTLEMIAYQEGLVAKGPIPPLPMPARVRVPSSLDC